MKPRLLLALGLCLCCLFLAAPAAGELDLSQRYLFLHTSRDSTMQKELDQAAAAGYRVLFGASAGGDTSLLLEKVATPPDTYQYLLLSVNKKSLTEAELSDAGARGFRLLPQTIFGSHKMLLEKAPGPLARYQYRFLNPPRRDDRAEQEAFYQQFAQMLGDGYAVVGFTSGRRVLLIVQKQMEASEEPAGTARSGLASDSGSPYALFMMTDVPHVNSQQELNKAGAAGYRACLGSSSSEALSIHLLLEKALAPPGPYEYLILATNLTSTMEKEMNQAPAQGFRLHARILTGNRGFPMAAGEMAVVMERPWASNTSYQYRLLATTKTETLQKELMEATRNGYQIVAMMRSGAGGSILFSSRPEHIVILEKAEGPGGR